MDTYPKYPQRAIKRRGDQDKEQIHAARLTSLPSWADIDLQVLVQAMPSDLLKKKIILISRAVWKLPARMAKHYPGVPFPGQHVTLA
jgi:hypothetical protein